MVCALYSPSLHLLPLPLTLTIPPSTTHHLPFAFPFSGTFIVRQKYFLFICFLMLFNVKSFPSIFTFQFPFFFCNFPFIISFIHLESHCRFWQATKTCFQERNDVKIGGFPRREGEFRSRERETNREKEPWPKCREELRRNYKMSCQINWFFLCFFLLLFHNSTNLSIRVTKKTFTNHTNKRSNIQEINAVAQPK